MDKLGYILGKVHTVVYEYLACRYNKLEKLEITMVNKTLFCFLREESRDKGHKRLWSALDIPVHLAGAGIELDFLMLQDLV